MTHMKNEAEESVLSAGGESTAEAPRTLGYCLSQI